MIARGSERSGGRGAPVDFSLWSEQMPSHFASPSMRDWVGIAEAGYRQLRRARATADAGHRCLDQARSKLRGRERVETTEVTASRQSLAPSSVPVHIDAWLELGDGTAEQDDELRQAVHEIVQLQILFIEALCRHFPAISQSIREVARHLLEDATNLTNAACCGGAATVAPGHMGERAN